MSLEATMDELIVSLNKNTEALLAAKGAASTDAGASAKTTAKAKAKEGPTSIHTAAEVKDRFNTLKADKTKLPALKKVIADLGASSLDELVGKAELLDKAWDALEALDVPAAEVEDDL